MSVIYTTQFESPLGTLILGDYNGTICLLDWYYRKSRLAIDHRICTFLSAQYLSQHTPLHSETIKQLADYLKGDKQIFDIPLTLAGSPFQQKVWQQLMLIPFGTTLSYLELSKKIGDAKAIRAVANANGANAISIIIPCHRVIGSNGNLTGYAGGLKAKQQLLQLEAPDLFSEIF